MIEADRKRGPYGINFISQCLMNTTLVSLTMHDRKLDDCHLIEDPEPFASAIDACVTLDKVQKVNVIIKEET